MHPTKISDEHTSEKNYTKIVLPFVMYSRLSRQCFQNEVVFARVNEEPAQGWNSQYAFLYGSYVCEHTD